MSHVLGAATMMMKAGGDEDEAADRIGERRMVVSSSYP